jgi:hypothetical protein
MRHSTTLPGLIMILWSSTFAITPAFRYEMLLAVFDRLTSHTFERLDELRVLTIESSQERKVIESAPQFEITLSDMAGIVESEFRNVILSLRVSENDSIVLPMNTFAAHLLIKDIVQKLSSLYLELPVGTTRLDHENVMLRILRKDWVMLKAEFELYTLLRAGSLAFNLRGQHLSEANIQARVGMLMVVDAKNATEKVLDRLHDIFTERVEEERVYWGNSEYQAVFDRVNFEEGKLVDLVDLYEPLAKKTETAFLSDFIPNGRVILISIRGYIETLSELLAILPVKQKTHTKRFAHERKRLELLVDEWEIVLRFIGAVWPDTQL